MARIQKSEQTEHTPEEFAELVEKQRAHRELMDRLNAKFSRPGAWTIGKELGELPLAIGIVNAITKHGPRKEDEEQQRRSRRPQSKIVPPLNSNWPAN